MSAIEKKSTLRYHRTVGTITCYILIFSAFCHKNFYAFSMTEKLSEPKDQEGGTLIYEEVFLYRVRDTIFSKSDVSRIRAWLKSCLCLYPSSVQKVFLTKKLEDILPFLKLSVYTKNQNIYLKDSLKNNFVQALRLDKKCSTYINKLELRYIENSSDKNSMDQDTIEKNVERNSERAMIEDFLRVEVFIRSRTSKGKSNQVNLENFKGDQEETQESARKMTKDIMSLVNSVINQVNHTRYTTK